MNDYSTGSGSQKLSLAPALLLCFALAAIECWWRLFVYRNSPVGVGYSLPILLVGWTRRRNLLWAACAVFAVMAAVKFTFNHQTSALPMYKQVISIIMVMVDLLVITAIVDMVVRRESDLFARTEKLHQREQELKMSNEGLLERQQTMDTLLELSRSLSVGQTRDDVTRAIAGTIRQLLGESTATAIWSRSGDKIEIMGWDGFGDGGPQVVSAAPAGSFAGLVLERNQPVAITNISQNPEIRTERTADGATLFQAMLGAPLRSGSDVEGALVIYSHLARAWTESDISLVESLGAQASVSIAATRLLERAENEHRELQTIVDAVPFGILRTNAAATRLICNPAASSMLGFPEIIEAEAKDWPQMTLIGNKGEIPGARSPLLRALRGEVMAATELTMRLENGETLSILCNAAPIRDGSGAICGGVCAFVDISVVKSLREELKKQGRNNDEAAYAKRRFLQAVSHDIRNPANAINLLVELLRKSASDPSQADEVPEILREIEQTSGSMVKLVTDALDLVRLDFGPVELHESEIELGIWMDEQCKQFAAQAARKNLAFACEVPDGSTRLRADKGKLSRTLGVLISNAIKFTDQGEVRIEASLLDDRTLRIDVSDTGVGIAPENLADIFNEYVQIKSPQRSKIGGTGLELAISRRMAGVMGGKLEVVSEPGKGSTFSLFLPSSKVIR